jgi:hypothetical protein
MSCVQVGLESELKTRGRGVLSRHRGVKIAMGGAARSLHLREHHRGLVGRANQFSAEHIRFELDGSPLPPGAGQYVPDLHSQVVGSITIAEPL